MISQRWRDLLKQPGALPALPEVLIKLRAELSDLTVDIDRLCVELQADPSLVAEILKTINSPLFGVPRRITSVKQAVVLLGLRRVRAIIFSQSLRQSLATYQSSAFSLFNWWDRSLLQAVAATTLCQRTAPELVEEAYLAGLVADLGVLALARFERRYEAILRAHRGRACEELCRAEAEAFDIDHCELGAGIFEHWNFPASLVNTVLRHHDPLVLNEPQAFVLPGTVHFATLLTDCVVTNRQDLCERLIAAAQGNMFMSGRELAEFVTTCLERYRDVATALGHGWLADHGLPPALAQSA